MEKYKILLVVRYPIGGIRTFFRYVYTNFDLQHYQFTLISPKLSEIDVLLEDLKILDLSYIPVDKNINNKDFLKAITKVIQRNKFDLIHSHGFTCAICSTPGSLLSHTPHIISLHETLTEERFTGITGLFKKSMLGIILSMANIIQCVSFDAQDNLLTYLQILRFFKQKIITIPNGIKINSFLYAEKRDLRKEFNLAPDSFLIGFLGRYMPEKGFSYLIDALALMKEKQNLPRQPIVLSFNEEDGYIREEKLNVIDKGLKDSVLFLPFVADVAPTLKGLDVVVMPSVREACSLLAMEVMVAGVPLIGTSCIGLRELLENTSATVIPPKDSRALAEAIIMELEKPTTLKANQFATKAAARFDVSRSAAELEKLILKFVEA